MADSKYQIPAEIDAELTPNARAFVLALLSQIQSLQSEVDELKREVAELKRFGRGKPDKKPPESPPSGEGVATSTQNPPKRQRGAQRGHKKHERSLIATEECDRVETLKPSECRRCGHALAGEDAEPRRHQVFELPPIKLHVTEYQLHRLLCPCCQTTTCAELPPGVASGQTGPRLAAFVTLLMAMFRQSKRRVGLFCETLFNHPMSPGLVVKLQKQSTDALRPHYDELVAAIPKQPVVCADETPTKQASNNAWIWTVVTATFTVYAVRLTKAASVIKELLGEQYTGVVMSDRAKAYLWVSRHQWCWAHLLRDFEKMATRPGEAGKIGDRLMDIAHRLFSHWHRSRDGTITTRAYLGEMTKLSKEMRPILEEGAACANRATAATCRELLRGFDNLWLFPYLAMDPTNNAAERALRHGVIWRKLSFGTQSESGSRFVETMLTILETCRQRQQCAFDHLVDAITAHRKQPAPSLATS